MPRPYSTDLRERALLACEHGSDRSVEAGPCLAQTSAVAASVDEIAATSTYTVTRSKPERAICAA
jgi:hypothetical protein